ncbi:WD repeat-containing protein 33, partial [Coemansia sp. RSA 486]
MGRGGYHMNHPRPYQTMNQQQHQYNGQDNNDGTQQSTRPNKQVQRKTIDYYGATVRGLELRTGGAAMSLKTLPCDPSYTVDVFPPIFVPNEPETSMTTRFIWDSKNMVRYPVNVVRWMPDGRFLVTGSSSGEFTLWNGLTFKFETISSAHDTTIRSMKWSHNSEWMISGDSGGIIKYWQPNMNNVKIIQGHSKSVRELSFSPSDVKFVSASDDQQIKIWDFGRGVEEQTLNGHINEVRTVDWHPQLGMISSSGKDKIIKLWDPRSGKCLSNIRAHNGAITGLQWNRNGRWLLSGGRDHSIKLFDIRNIKEELVS